MKQQKQSRASTFKTRTTRITTAGKRIFHYVLIGVIAGLGSIVFQYLCQVGLHVFLDQMAGYNPPSPAGESHLFEPSGTPFIRWMLFFLPAAGGIISGWLVYTFAPEAEGHGTDAAIDAYHNKGGFIRGRIPFVKTIASAITITSGGSGGREGPIAQIGAGFGSYLGTKLKLSERERRIMMAAGLGAGVGSIFRAPLAGALFAAEVLYRDPEFEPEVIIPAGISSVVAYCLFCLFFGWGSLFQSQDFVFQNPLELGPYIVLAFVLVGTAILYIRVFYGVRDLFKRLRVPNHIKPAIGGLCTGAIGFFIPATLAFGYGYAQMALNNVPPPLFGSATLFLIGLAFGKILTTSFSIGSGGSGGVFGPSIFIGGMLGGVVGGIGHHFTPEVVGQSGAFVLVGMAAFFAGVAKTPIGAILMVCEMTGSYHLLAPLLLVSAIHMLLNRRVSIYEKQVVNRFASPAHLGDLTINILKEIRVGEVFDERLPVVVLTEGMRFSELREVITDSEGMDFPVMDENNHLTGILSINQIRQVLFYFPVR